MLDALIGSLGSAPTRNYIPFLKIGFVVAGVGFIPIISTKRINQIRKGNCKFYAYKKIYYIFKNMGASRVGAIPRLPHNIRL